MLIFHFDFGSVGVQISENVKKLTLIKILFYIGIEVKWNVFVSFAVHFYNSNMEFLELFDNWIAF